MIKCQAKRDYEDSRWRLACEIFWAWRSARRATHAASSERGRREIVAESLHRVLKYAQNTNNDAMPDDVLFVPMDGKLIETSYQSLDNAVSILRQTMKYCACPAEMSVSFLRCKIRIWIWWGDLSNIFDSLCRSIMDTRFRRRLGLGLRLQSNCPSHGARLKHSWTADTGRHQVLHQV